MTFYERFEELCAEKGLKPQNPAIQAVAGVSSPAISGWKKGSLPKVEVLFRFADYFNVTLDYLLGRSEVRFPGLSEEETLLLDAYRSATKQGQFHIIQVCMNEQEVGKRESVNAG